MSKDINMRIKAHTMGLPAEDYFNDQVLEDTDLLYTGVLPLPADFWEKHGKGVESWQQGGQTFYRISGPLVSSLLLNQFVYFEGDMPLVAQVREITGRTAVLQTLRDYGHHKNAVWGITARNREQNFALNLLMNPEIDFITLLGQAGTGKTLIALAAGLEQVLETKRYTEIIMTRATVPVGEDIGYLPGTEEEKMQPWIARSKTTSRYSTRATRRRMGRATANDLIRSRVKVKALSFMRGRTFSNKYPIIRRGAEPHAEADEDAGHARGARHRRLPGQHRRSTRLYLTEGSSGLTYVVDCFKGWPHAAMSRCSAASARWLADFATDVAL